MLRKNKKNCPGVGYCARPLGWGQEGGHLGQSIGIQARDMDDRVIHDIMDVLGRPQGSNPQDFVSLSLLFAEAKAEALEADLFRGESPSRNTTGL